MLAETLVIVGCQKHKYRLLKLPITIPIHLLKQISNILNELYSSHQGHLLIDKHQVDWILTVGFLEKGVGGCAAVGGRAADAAAPRDQPAAAASRQGDQPDEEEVHEAALDGGAGRRG